MIANDHDLLRQFTQEHSQDAFAELVSRHVNLVYSAALRQVRSPELAQEVCQTVFSQLACRASTLRKESILTAWLYQVAHHAAIDLVRREARRQARERLAVEMSDMNDTPADWTHLEPVLDEGLQSLEENDRTALLLRYFENKSLREVGEALGASEDAAQKRVSRAIERLREFFGKRKLAIGGSGLVALLSANAVQAAPPGLAGSIAATAFMSSATISTVTTATSIAKSLAMTTFQKALVTTVITGAVLAGLYEAHKTSQLRDEFQEFKQQQLARQVALSNQLQEVSAERDHATNALATLSDENVSLKKNPTDVLKLRGEVGRLRRENANLGSTSGLSKVTANPEMRKMVRDQQKMGMTVIYKEFAQRMKLAPEQTDKLNDILADHIMENVDQVTTVLRDKVPADQMNDVFTAQDAALLSKVEALLGPEVAAQYQDYTKNLLSMLTAEQFKAKMTGTDEEKEAKASQLRQVVQEEIQSALAGAGLPSDYQPLSILNFRNIASEQEEEKSLKLLGQIYQGVAGRATSFLTAEDLQKFQEFQNAAITSSRAALNLNRTMMEPISN